MRKKITIFELKSAEKSLEDAFITIIDENTKKRRAEAEAAEKAKELEKELKEESKKAQKEEKAEENIRSTNGIFDSPIEVNIVERMLYINRNGNPTK